MAKLSPCLLLVVLAAAVSSSIDHSHLLLYVTLATHSPRARVVVVVVAFASLTIIQ
jgi:hypothetical protein